MAIAEEVLTRLRALPPDRQQEVLDFVQFLQTKSAARTPRRSLRGLWSDLRVDITEEDIAEVRREMWGGFPREDI